MAIPSPDVDVVFFDAVSVRGSLYNFDKEKFRLKTTHTNFIDAEIIPRLNAGPHALSLYGKTSKTGSRDYNLKLSADREQAVESYIRARAAVTVFDSGAYGWDQTIAPGEDPRSRCVDFVIHPLGSPPPPPTPPPAPNPPPTPTTTAVGTVAVDIIGWIPQPEVANPLDFVPNVLRPYLTTHMYDPFFGGDAFTTPASAPSGMVPPFHTFRAKQSRSFSIASWGDPPMGSAMVSTPGTTTCLDKRRAAGGKVTFSMPATLISQSTSLAYSSSDDWYELEMQGKVMDPVPAAAAAEIAKLAASATLPPLLRGLAASIPSLIAAKVSPSLEWDLTLRFQHGSVIPKLTQLNYDAHAGDDSGKLAGAGDLRAGPNLVHGVVDHLGIWPSLAVYVTFTPPSGGDLIQVVMFADGSGFSSPPLILVPKWRRLRRVAW